MAVAGEFVAAQLKGRDAQHRNDDEKRGEGETEPAEPLSREETDQACGRERADVDISVDQVAVARFLFALHDGEVDKGVHGECIGAEDEAQSQHGEDDLQRGRPGMAGSEIHGGNLVAR